MARIVVITHQYDEFSRPQRFWQPRTSNYLLYDVLRMVERRGHRVRVVAGPRATPGDVGILHVDSTRVDEDYLALAPLYPIALNFGTGDISKRRISRLLLVRGDAWAGPVIVKLDLNCTGVAEREHNVRAARAGAAAKPHPDVSEDGQYTVHPSLAEVPADVWDNPALVVERFLPERDAEGFAVRSWVFMGRWERCSRRVSADPIVKAHNSARAVVDPPDGLRAERARLGFDYGKFDFVMHDGAPILLDANRTPGRPSGTEAELAPRAAFLADGLEDLISTGR